ncbi:undecaprenyl-diphosphate phosphatase [Sneathia sanguinegens]|uniref:undecaprenyl-diphosphate phosphatase n=1 Tax=Sneathia sanguinegens TaxID=40543 RepID=UPI0023F8E85E|nr:undecaprenyl-diphosphate phosphatase [Sneathia sanguinegens]
MFLQIIKVIILSFIEGLTEFIPVSSTGHMILIEHFLKLSTNKNFVNSFEIIIQLGAILSVVIYFRKKIFPINICLWTKIIIAMLPAAVIGVLADDFIDAHLFNVYVVVAMLIIYGVILIFLEKITKNKKIENLTQISYKKAFIIGLFQCLAMIPGTSRSAATIMGAMLMGISRIAATEFSFFLAIPTMLGATALKLLKIKSMGAMEMSLIALGFVLSFIFAYIFIAMFMDYIKKHNFKIFGYYRIILGIIVAIILVR